MYRIIKMETGETMALTERPNWIRLWQDVYILCGEDKADGVTVNGTPCRLAGRPAMKGTEPDVCLEEVDAGMIFEENTAFVADIAQMCFDHEYRVSMMELEGGETV